MELEFFEPRPPQVAAVKLDFLDDPDGEVAEKLRTMPGVKEVAVEYGYDGRKVIVNPHDDKRGVLVDGCWLVCTLPPPDSMFFDVEVNMLGDSQFQRRYRRVESHITIGTVNYADATH